MEEHAFRQTEWSLQDLLPAHEGAELEQLLTELEEQVSAMEVPAIPHSITRLSTATPTASAICW